MKASKNRIQNQRPIAVDLFAGAGGFSLGIEQAGFDVMVAVEHDPIHACTYCFNFPLTRVLNIDATTVSANAIASAVKHAYKLHHPHASNTWNGKIDLVFGGPPCQGFSIIGKRSLDDQRNNLVFHFHRLVTALNPRYFVMENVPGMAFGRCLPWLEQLQTKFVQAGYDVEVQILDAAHFGVPQRRRRLFLIGAQNGVVPANLPHPQHKLVTVGDAIADLPDLDDFPELLRSDEVLLNTALLQQLQQTASNYAKFLRGELPQIEDFSYRRAWNPQLLTSSMRTQHNENTIQRFAQMHPNQRESISHLRRLDINGLSHTLRAGTGSEHGSHTSPRPIHPTSPRVISVREAARLHSFPDWFRFHVTKWHGFRQVGNAVPPLLAHAVGRQIIKSLCLIPSLPTQSLTLGDPQLLKFNRFAATKHSKCL